MRRSRRKLEWVGGRVTLSCLAAKPTLHHPDVLLWVSLPDGRLVAGVTVYPPDPAVSLGEALLEGMRRPMEGLPRRPGRVRVANEALAEEVRAVAPELEVVVAPTPEIDELAQIFAHTVPGPGDASYFEGLSVPEEVVVALFQGARRLYLADPWQKGAGPVRLDIPELDVVGACVLITGAPTQLPSIGVFPSLDDLHAVLEAELAMRDDEGNFVPPGPDEVADFGSDMLGVVFVGAEELPRIMRQEADDHGWQVAGPEAYPVPLKRCRDGSRDRLRERNVHVLASCCTAVAAFAAERGHLFGLELSEPVFASYIDDNGVEARITYPYGPWHLHEAGDPRAAARPVIDELFAGLARRKPARARVPRSIPCPCGSGKEYRHCCQDDDPAAEHHREAGSGRAGHRNLIYAVITWGYRVGAKPLEFDERRQQILSEHLGLGFESFTELDTTDLAGTLGQERADAFQRWVDEDLVTRVRDGEEASLVAAYIERNAWRLDARDLEFLQALDASAAGFYEVAAVRPSHGVDLVDLIHGGDPIAVIDDEASEHLRPGRRIACRILDLDGGKILSPAPLVFPLGAAGVALPVLEKIIALAIARVGAGSEPTQADAELIESIVQDWAKADAAPSLSVAWMRRTVRALKELGKSG